MLERASSCLESGGRRVLGGPKRSVKSKRLLHSAFWHHGAGDLKLPTWWNSVAQSVPEKGLGNVEGAPHGVNVAIEDGTGRRGATLLDFLYPTNTLAFMQHISAVYCDTMVTRSPRPLRPSGIRQFSSFTGSRTPAIIDMDKPETVKDIRYQYSQSDPIAALEKLLEKEQGGDQELVWKLYEQANTEDISSDLHARLLDYVATSPRLEDTERTLKLFDLLPFEYRQPSSYRAAIGALLRLKMSGQAVVLHSDAAKRSFKGNFGTDILLGRLIYDKQWRLAFRVYETFKDKAALDMEPDQSDQESPDIWSLSKRIPNIPQVVMSLLEYEQQSGHLSTFPDKAPRWREFISELILAAVQNPRQEHVELYVDFFELLQRLDLARKQYWEDAIMRLVERASSGRYKRGGTLHWRLYKQYASLAKQRVNDEFFKPSEELLALLVRRLCQYTTRSFRTNTSSNFVRLEWVIEDWELFHGTVPRNVQQEILQTFAHRGDSISVFQYFEKFRQSWRESGITAQDLHPLLYVYARQVDVHKTTEQFERIGDKFGLAPDARCWNILIQSHIRASDLDGALSRFNDMIESGCAPNSETFEPLLHGHSQKGDVDAVRELMELAKQLGAPISPKDANYWIVVAHVQDGNMKAAEELATQCLQEPGSRITRTWNTLMTAYAFREDVSSVMRLYKQMQHHHIRMDEYTYAAILRSLCIVRQTDRAYKILRTTMLQNNIQILPMHQAIIMVGYCRQLQPRKAINVYKAMTNRNMAPSISTRIAYIEAKTFLLRQHIKQNTLTKPVQDYTHELESDLESVMNDFDPSDVAEEKSTFVGFAPVKEALSQAYFTSLMHIYGLHQAHEVFHQIFKHVFESGDAKINALSAPLRLLTQAMNSLISAGDLEQVDKLWQLALVQANRFASKERSEFFPRMPSYPSASFSQTISMSNDETDAIVEEQDTLSATSGAKHSKQPDPEEAEPVSNASKESTNPNPSLPEVQVWPGMVKLFSSEPHQSPVLAANRRLLLSAPLNVYIKALMHSRRFDTIRSTVEELDSQGYVFDNSVWNSYIEVSARSGHIVEAFKTCEERLMDHWRGWNYKASLSDASQWRKYSGFYRIKFPWPKLKMRKNKYFLLPTYRTMVILAGAIVQVRREAAVLNEEGQRHGSLNVWQGQDLLQIAPRTLHALENLPLIKGDELQKQFLRGV